jgi:cellulose synthase/poly-beta-1,6-N-acetylglucosamine synthase-like glycosyltransferase
VIILFIISLILLLHYSVCAIIIAKGINGIIKTGADNFNNEFVSVIIPFRNESENILTSLESMRNLNYSSDKFEVIYVNDKSDDNSLNILTNALNKGNIKVISVPEDYLSDESKIRAVKFGIDNSNGKIIVTTDCDCTHNSNWLTSMVNCFDQNTGFIAGPVDFVDNNSIFKKLQKLEFAGLVLSGAGLIGIKKPIICNSANLAFRKDVYEKIGGFKVDKGLSYSADEYLMIDIHNSSGWKIKFTWNNDAIVKTKAKNSLKDFFHQRQRWANKDWKLFGRGILLHLVIVYLFFTSLVFQFAAGFMISELFFYSLLISLVIKLISEYQILRYGINFLFDKKLLWLLPLAEVLHIPYILISGISGILKISNRKNGRQNW